MEILRTVGLTKAYGKGSTEFLALDNIDFSVEQGEFITVLGSSGSGKSTLLHILGGLDQPTSGKVYVEGQDLYSLSEKELAIYRRRKYGFIFQQFNLIPVLTAEENVTLPLLLDNKKVNYTYIDELFIFLGIENRKKHLPNALSGGQQQRVAIARALANKPSIIFADEPTGNLDSKSSADVMRLLRESAKRLNQTIIMITHDDSLVEYSDRTVRIQDGRLLLESVEVR